MQWTKGLKYREKTERRVGKQYKNIFNNIGTNNKNILCGIESSKTNSDGQC